MIVTRWHTARGIRKWVLDRLDLAAIVWPWRSVWIQPEWVGNVNLIQHERWHLHQINRDGPIRFTIAYLYHLATKGYRRNPYEVEAYRNQNRNPPHYEEVHEERGDAREGRQEVARSVEESPV